MPHAVAYLGGGELMVVDERQYLFDIQRRLVGRHPQHVRLLVEVAVLFAVGERQSPRSILAVLQRLDDGNAVAMSSSWPKS